MKMKAIRLCRLREALSTSASASSSPSVHHGASLAPLAKPMSTENFNRPEVLVSTWFSELRRPVANLGASSCPVSVRLLWAGRSGSFCEKVEELDNNRSESSFRFQESEESEGDGMSTEEVLLENASQGTFRMSNVIGDPEEPLIEEKDKYTVLDHHGHKPHVDVANEIWSAREQDGSNPFGDDSDKVHLREPNK